MELIVPSELVVTVSELTVEWMTQIYITAVILLNERTVCIVDDQSLKLNTKKIEPRTVTRREQIGSKTQRQALEKLCGKVKKHN